MKNLPRKILLASHNAGKLREFQMLFAPMGVDMVSAADLNLPEPEETGQTFEENALLKARAAAQAANMPALADDSGLCVVPMNNAPGIYSARWAGESKDFQMAMRRVLDGLQGQENRAAYFIAVLALVTPEGEEICAEGRETGTIADAPRGENGFGYDPIFIPDGETRTFGEMSMTEKKAHNHRVHAFQHLKTLLNK